jgi:hypothetical protein
MLPVQNRSKVFDPRLLLKDHQKKENYSTHNPFATLSIYIWWLGSLSRESKQHKKLDHNVKEIDEENEILEFLAGNPDLDLVHCHYPQNDNCSNDWNHFFHPNLHRATCQLPCRYQQKYQNYPPHPSLLLHSDDKEFELPKPKCQWLETNLINHSLIQFPGYPFFNYHPLALVAGNNQPQYSSNEHPIPRRNQLQLNTAPNYRCLNTGHLLESTIAPYSMTYSATRLIGQ